jgi:hypothetical protein
LNLGILETSLLVIICLIAFLAVVWLAAVIDILRKPSRKGRRALWLLIVLCLPFVGAVVYFMIGRNGAQAAETRD